MSEPNVSGREWEYVKECLDTGWVSSVGAFVDRFEHEFAGAVGARYAVAMASGTAALHVALLVSGIRPNEEVVLPTLTFIAPANTVRYVGAWPVFVDVEPNYWQLDPAQLEAFLLEDCQRRDGGLVNRRTGRRVAAVLPVDILGHPCDLGAIQRLAADRNLVVVEDATESLGAHYRDRKLGQCSRVSCFSFNGNKLITTGGGGMLVTDDEVIARRARYLATQAKDDAVEYVHKAVGFNYRLTNIQAAMGCAQLEQLGSFLASKRTIADRYAHAFAEIPGIRPMREAPWARSSWWLYSVLVDQPVFGMDSRALLSTLAELRIHTRPLWQPMHRSPAHDGSFSRPCPVGDVVHRDALSLPCSTHLTAVAQQRVIAGIRESAAGC